MSWYRKIDHATASVQPNALSHGMSIGTVIDTNDPQQMGRLRVMVPSLGDNLEKKVSDFPWAMYVSPLAGTNFVGPRGNEDTHVTSGPVNYGMWNIPKIGAQVLVACIDGDPNLRIWLGCITPQWTPHTMPHGRYIHDGDTPDGPLSSTEHPIQPLYDNLSEAFGGRDSFEFRSRGIDQQVANINNEEVPKVVSGTADDIGKTITLPDGTTKIVTQGYTRSRIEPNVDTPNTGGVNYDSQVYSWTTPGFHSISMNDLAENCRMRFRTTSGHQIILDDTNERIYIATAKGNNYIEMDQNGNIDIHSDRRISVHATKDINFETEGAFRVKAAKGIHMQTDMDFRVQATLNIHQKAGNDIYSQAANNINGLAGSVVSLESGANTNIRAGGDIRETGTQIHMNSSSPNNADSADPANDAYLPNRVPRRESTKWGRIMYVNTDNDTGNVQTPEFAYTDESVGRVELGEKIPRGTHWQR